MMIGENFEKTVKSLSLDIFYIDKVVGDQKL